MLLFIPIICYLLLFLFSHYFFYVYPTYTLNIAISVPAKQVRDAAWQREDHWSSGKENDCEMLNLA